MSTIRKKNPIDVFKERGLLKQCTDEQKVRELFAKSEVTAYIGFDPTAKSLHVGTMTPIMALKHLELEGHRPIAVVGGGTGLVGDPSGKTEQRQLLTREGLSENFEAIKKQLGRFLSFKKGPALAINNADWIENLNYIEFLRDIGRHFSVNKMLSFEAYKTRMEKGLSFLEFNYQILQAFDFLTLFKKYDCLLQMGGDDQWGNMVAGTDLIRRVTGGEAHALTFPLITTSAGEKMGKTAKGAVWLDAEMYSPYDYFQYWVNASDDDVGRFLGLFTFLPMDEIERLAALKGAELREAKQILAFEATRFCHGEVEAIRARDGAKAAFSGTGDVENIPSTTFSSAQIGEGLRATEVFVEIGLCASKGQAAKLFKGGGARVGNRQLKNHNEMIVLTDFDDGQVMLRAGKKRLHRLVLPK